MDRYRLSEGSINRILAGETPDNVILQILGYKRIENNEDRYRLMLYDGSIRFLHGVLAKNLSHLISNKQLEMHTIILLKGYSLGYLQSGATYIFCTVVEVLVPGSVVNRNISQNGQSSNVSQNRAPVQSVSNEREDLDVEMVAAVITPPKFQPIDSLTPYQSKWTIRARVTHKTRVITYSNQRGEGRYFSFSLVDESGEIQATVFQDCIDDFYDLIEVEKVYYISNATVKMSGYQNKLVENDYELSFNSITKVELFTGDDVDIPTIRSSFIPIHEIPTIKKDSFIDVIGVSNIICDVTPQKIRSTNEEISKRDIHLLDPTGSILVTFWGDEAENLVHRGKHVIAIKNAKVVDFHGTSLTISSMSTFTVNPGIPEAIELRDWYKTLTQSQVQSLSLNLTQLKNQNWQTVNELGTDLVENSNDSSYAMAKAAVVTFNKDHCMYQACSNSDCYKKARIMDNGAYRCDKCNTESDDFKWVLMMSAKIADYSGETYATAFNDSAETILGYQAAQLHEIKTTNEDRYYDLLSNVHFKFYMFKLRSKMETYNERTQLKTTVVSASPLDPLLYAQKLLSDIRRMALLLP